MAKLTIARRTPREWWREYRSTALFLFLMLMFRSAWADWVSVPTGSMNPTIIEGDRVLVDKHVYGVRIPWTLVRLTEGRDPRRGEIVVFDSPVDGISLVKRVVGVPGDTVALGPDGLVINGVRARYSAGEVALPAHDILRIPGGSPAEFMEPVHVPEGMYFMLGDNRDNSRDSRYIGFVPRRNIVGLASRVAVSFDPENHYALRGRRFFHPLD